MGTAAVAELVNARQVLRWTLRDHPAAAATPALAATALQDFDWELRATAMLAIGLLGIDDLRPHARRLSWNPGPSNGPTSADARLLAEWQAAIAGGAPVEQPVPRDHETMLLYALLEPLSIPPLDRFPHRTGYRYVAREPHWLGDARPDMKFSNPIRRVTPPAGFWISEERVGDASFPGALAAAAHQARVSGREVRLPTSDEWEMAARSTDARLFPWGNGFEAGAPELPSPWGLTGLMRARGEWCIESVSDPRPVLCGSSKKIGLPGRVLDAPPDFAAGYRFIVSFEEGES